MTQRKPRAVTRPPAAGHGELQFRAFRAAALGPFDTHPPWMADKTFGQMSKAELRAVIAWHHMRAATPK